MTYAITILNKSGVDLARFVQFHNKFYRISNIKGTCYDKNGNLIKKVKRKEFLDIPAISGYSLYEDTRAVIYDPNLNDFPFTVEYQYTYDFNGFLNYPSWTLYEDYNVAVEYKKLKIQIPSNMDFRTYNQNFNKDATISEADSYKIFEWQVMDLPALQEEPLSPELSNLTKAIFIAPEKFKLDGIEGDMSSWNSFGDWIYQLNNERDVLNEEAKLRIKD